MIYKRGKRWRVIVYAGRDPITGRKRQKSISVATRAEAKQAEARLITEVGAGQHRATTNRTVAELLDRWLEWRLSVRRISPTTVATDRGYIDRAIRPTLGKLQLGRLDAAFLVAELAAILGGIMRAVTRSDEVSAGWPGAAMLLCGLGTIGFNVGHAYLLGGRGDPLTVWRCVVAALPPVLMMVSFQVLIASSGSCCTWAAP